MRRGGSDRAAAIAWAAATIARPDVLFLDTETTGLGHDAEVVEIAVLDSHGTPLLDTLVRPQRPIPREATAIHRISDAMVVNAPTWPDVYTELLGLLRTRPHVVVYNAAFDRRIIQQTNRQHAIAAPTARWHCVMLQYAAFAGQRNPRTGDYRWHSLERATAAVGVPQPSHRARGDADACRALVHAMALHARR